MSAANLDHASMEDFRHMAATLVGVEALADELDRLPEGVVIDVREEVTGPLRAILATEAPR